MLFRRRESESWWERLRVHLWPRRSWSRSGRYVVYRLRRLSASPHAIALGFAAGAFAAATPYIGTHLMMGALVAWAVGGSVVASVTVPDFAREDVSLSGLLLAGGPAVPTEGADAFGDLVPVVPTTERLFDSSDTVTVFGRLYQRDRRPRPIMVTTRVVDASGAVVHEASETVAAERFGAGGAADVTWPLPLATLIPGAYELQVVATLDRERTATRTATFGVRGRE